MVTPLTQREAENVFDNRASVLDLTDTHVLAASEDGGLHILLRMSLQVPEIRSPFHLVASYTHNEYEATPVHGWLDWFRVFAIKYCDYLDSQKEVWE